MDTESQGNLVIQALRKGDLIGQQRQSSHQVYEVIAVADARVFAMCAVSWTIRSVALQDVAPPF